MRPFLFLFVALLAAPPAAAEEFTALPEVATFIAAMHERHGFDPARLRAEFAGIAAEPTVLRLIAPPTSPTQRSWQRYRARFLTPQRIAGGAAFWASHADDVERAAAQFGVPPEIIVAIIGVETEYGRNTGRFNVLQALATLAFYYPPRADFFRAELEEFLLLARDNQLDLATTRGSYAGAIGIPQFMPSSERRFAVDFDGDGRIDLSASPADAIGSVASFLAAHGWRSGAPITIAAPPAFVPPPEWVDAGLRPTLDIAPISAIGRLPATLNADDKTAVVELVTPEGKTEYWWGFDNFYVITRYNRSSFYAMAVAQLGEAIVRARNDGGVEPAAAKAGSRATRRHAG